MHLQLIAGVLTTNLYLKKNIFEGNVILSELKVSIRKCDIFLLVSRVALNAIPNHQMLL